MPSSGAPAAEASKPVGEGPHPGGFYWVKWADPENEDKWVAVFITNGYVPFALKKGFKYFPESRIVTPAESCRRAALLPARPRSRASPAGRSPQGSALVRAWGPEAGPKAR